MSNKNLVLPPTKFCLYYSYRMLYNIKHSKKKKKLECSTIKLTFFSRYEKGVAFNAADVLAKDKVKAKKSSTHSNSWDKSPAPKEK